MEVTLSEEFDSIYKSIQEVLEEEGICATKHGKLVAVDRLQLQLEELTQKVSRVEMFSRNEMYEEMDPKSLKFLLIPYFLGVIWQQKQGIERKDIWVIAEVYFRDFLERLVDAGILLTTPIILSLLQTQNENSEDKSPGMESVQPGGPRSLPTGDQNRRIKIARYKQGKELEEKIKILSDRDKNGGAEDDATIQELYLNLLRKHALDAESELESIFTEKELVSSHLKTSDQQSQSSSSAVKMKSQLPFETFIITKTDVQKKTFGLGYPSIPVMTVEELYQDRIQKGIWAKPTPTTADAGPPEDDSEGQAHEEALQEADDEQLRASKQAMDEYKDTHRRGWGNRMNRS